MRRILKKTGMKILLIIFISLFLIGCSGYDKSDTALSEIKGPKIGVARLTEGEKTLLESTGVERYFLFDIDYEKEPYNHMETWVEVYEKGMSKEKRQFISVGSEKILDINRLMFTNHSFKESSIYDKWVLSYITDQGQAHSNITIERPISVRVSYSSNIQVQKIEENKVIPLVIITVDTSDNDLTVPNEIFENESVIKDHIKNHDHVYILYCRFSKEL